MNTITDWQEQVHRAARVMELQWTGVEAEDLAQDLNLRLLESPKSVGVLKDMEEGVRYRALLEMAKQIAADTSTGAQVFSGNFRYSEDEVRELLEASAETLRIPTLGSSWSTGDYTRNGASDHSDPTASAVFRHLDATEVQRRLGEELSGLRAKNPRQYNALVERFVEGRIPDRLDTAAFMRIERALTALTTRMNQGHKRSHVDQPDGPGTRKAISNSAARFLSKEGWDADYMPAPSHMRDNHIEPEVWGR